MPPDYPFHPLLREVRSLARKLVFHHHRRGRGQPRGPVRFGLVFFPGLGNVHHFKTIFCAQPGHDLVEPLSGQAAGIIHKDADFEQGVSPLFFIHRGHAVKKLLRRQIVHHPQVRAFLPPAVEKNHRGHALDRVLAQ